MAFETELIVVNGLRDTLLAKLPAKVAAVNGQRAASIKSAFVEPFVVTAGMKMRVGNAFGAEVETALTEGTRTAAELAADFATAGVSATADADGHVVWTSTDAPARQAPSVLSILPDTTGANALLGLSPGGARCVRSAIAAPDARNFSDGWPLQHDFANEGFILVADDRQTNPVEDLHRNERMVHVDLVIAATEPNGQVSRNREFITSCLRCVREVLCTAEGRTLMGRVQLVQEVAATVKGRPFQPETLWPGNPLMESALYRVSVRVYENP